MKRTFILLAMIAGFGMACFAQDMTLDNILDKYAKTVGSEKISKWQTVIMTGKSVAGGAEYPFTVTLKRPDKAKTEAQVQGMKMIQVYDGKTGWIVMPWTGSTDPQPMTDDMVKSMKDQVEVEGSLYNWQQKGHKVEFVDKEDVEGSPAYKLKVTKANGNIENIFIDAENFVLLKSISTVKVQGNDAESESDFSDFKEVEGAMIPFTIISKYKEQTVSHVTIDKVEVNKDVADEVFAKPEKQEKK
jgi:outer membrane lipoprotein-sorting protein